MHGGALKLLPSLSIIKKKKKNLTKTTTMSKLVINLPWSTPPFFSTNYEPQKPLLCPFHNPIESYSSNCLCDNATQMACLLRI